MMMAKQLEVIRSHLQAGGSVSIRESGQIVYHLNSSEPSRKRMNVNGFSMSFQRQETTDKQQKNELASTILGKIVFGDVTLSPYGA